MDVHVNYAVVAEPARNGTHCKEEVESSSKTAFQIRNDGMEFSHCRKLHNSTASHVSHVLH